MIAKMIGVFVALCGGLGLALGWIGCWEDFFRTRVRSRRAKTLRDFAWTAFLGFGLIFFGVFVTLWSN